MANYLRKYLSLYSSTSNSFGTGEAVTITPNSVAGLPTDTEIVLTFDRVDSTGTATPSKMERIKGTISGGNLTVSSGGRGYDGSTAQAHTSPVVEMIWNAADWNEIITWGLVEHSQTGVHTAISLTGDITASDTHSIKDISGNEWIKFAKTASAVNEFTVTNAATGTRPQFAPTGGDSTISALFSGKSAFNSHTGEYNNGNSGSAYTVNWINGDRQLLTISASTTLSYSSAVTGQVLTLRLVENGTGGYICYLAVN